MKWATALGLMLTAAAACGCAGAPEAPPSLIADAGSTGAVPPPATGAAAPAQGAGPSSAQAPAQGAAQRSAHGWASPSPPAAQPVAQIVSGPAYQMSEQELKYDCKKLTGTMQIRILQIRDYETSKKTSTLARTAQAVATPIWGGTTVGIDPDGQYRKDLAMLQAYNQRLADKRCKTFDLAAELQSRGAHDMPAPTQKPAQQ
jgi:hypothetical protein